MLVLSFHCESPFFFFLLYFLFEFFSAPRIYFGGQKNKNSGGAEVRVSLVVSLVVIVWEEA